MNHYGCDRCGKVTTKDEMDGHRGIIPNDWESIQLQYIGPNRRTKRFDFCSECVVHLKLGEFVRVDLTESESVGERLVELLEELAQGVVESQ